MCQSAGPIRSLLDHSAAFDIIDHDALLYQFRKQYHFGQTAVQGVKSLLMDLMQQINVFDLLRQRFPTWAARIPMSFQGV